MAQGRTSFQRGDFAQAAKAWQQASALFAKQDKLKQQTDALVQLAEAYQALGQPQKALQTWHLAKTLAEKIQDQTRKAVVMAGLGKTYWLTGATAEAKQHLATSMTLARQAGDTRTVATSLNNLGNLLRTQGNYRQARIYYRESLALAQQAGNGTLIVTALTNAAETALLDKGYAEAQRLLPSALAQTRKLTASHDKAYALLALGRLLSTFPVNQARWSVLAYEAYAEAATLAQTLEDRRALAYAWGYLGQLYAQKQRDSEALYLTRRAVFAAQQARAPEILYRWQWQLGRLLKNQGDDDGALLAYQQAVTTLQGIRPDLSSSLAGTGQSFRAAVGEVFFELADLLLQRAARVIDPQQRQRYLIEARDTVENLRTAELKDYFQDDCVVALQSRITPLDRLAPRTAVLYPILLSERTELLLSLPEGMKQFRIPVDRETLTQTVRQLRRYLEKRTTREYLPYAQQLYRWLIAPIEGELQTHQIETLITVPDGPLRTVPMAALHDGKRFLIAKYVLATTPGLTLTDLRPIQRQDVQLLLNGLTKAVQGFPPLEYVSLELDTIHDAYGGTVLQDQDFLITKVQRALTKTPYSIVHIASHGQFAGDINNTFLLTFDDKLTMDHLERFMGLSQYREQPVELLTLSACQTAAGDDRAALGLAGVAIKAGARSALASLWFINDQASALLVSAFYEQLQNPALTKAKALQQAQLTLLADRRYQHPGYWSPFLLIGNWL